MKVLFELVNPQEHKKVGPAVLAHHMNNAQDRLDELRHDFNIAVDTDNRNELNNVRARMNMIQKNIMFMGIVLAGMMARQVQGVIIGNKQSVIFNN